MEKIFLLFEYVEFWFWGPSTLVSAGKVEGGCSQLGAVLRNGFGCLSKLGRIGCIADNHVTLGKGGDTSYP